MGLTPWQPPGRRGDSTILVLRTILCGTLNHIRTEPEAAFPQWIMTNMLGLAPASTKQGNLLRTDWRGSSQLGGLRNRQTAAQRVDPQALLTPGHMHTHTQAGSVCNSMAEAGGRFPAGLE